MVLALIECNFFSETLGLSTAMYVILPQQTSRQIGMDSVATRKRHPVLYLLHGMSDDHTIWLRRTSIERYVASRGIAVVMPEVHRSFYTDMDKGLPYWTFVSEELPAIVQSFFPISDSREETFVAGLSMGGYGAFKLALRQPHRFAAAASLSGAVDIATWSKQADRGGEWGNIFGDLDALAGSENDLMHLASVVANGVGPKPKLYQCCGTEDFLYDNNLRFRNHARALPLDLTYEEEPGHHEWDYWDMKIQCVLDWLPIRSQPYEQQ